MEKINDITTNHQDKISFLSKAASKTACKTLSKIAVTTNKKSNQIINICELPVVISHIIVHKTPKFTNAFDSDLSSSYCSSSSSSCNITDHSSGQNSSNEYDSNAPPSSDYVSSQINSEFNSSNCSSNQSPRLDSIKSSRINVETLALCEFKLDYNEIISQDAITVDINQCLLSSDDETPFKIPRMNSHENTPDSNASSRINSSRTRSESSLEMKKKNLYNMEHNLSEQILHLVNEINWKSKLEKDDIDKYEKLYHKIRNDISHVPKIIDVLKLSMPYVEKCELFEKLILLNNMSPMTTDFYDLKKYLNKVICDNKNFTISNEDHKKYKLLENALVVINVHKPIEYQILDLNISDYNKSFIYKRYKLLKDAEPGNFAYNNKLKKWIEWIIAIPTNIKPMLISLNDSSYEKNKYLWDVKNLLDAEIYGLEPVKEKILFLLNNKITNKDSKGLNFALSGPPGVAKTSIINVLSKSIDLPFFQINAAGMKDSSFLLGHNFTYEGSIPGAILQGLSTMKCKNGIIYFDEFDKISNTDQGVEISRTLLHITDFAQNHKFHDRYISEQIDIDLSNIWFIYSMNDKNLIDPTLRDRISIIEIEGYDKNEKKKIVTQFLLPTALKNINLSVSMVSINDAALDYLIDIADDTSIHKLNGKSGVRQLKHLIDEILMKINFLRTITEENDEISENKQLFKLSFKIKDFKLPIVVTKQIIMDLSIKKNPSDMSFYSMYC